MSVGTKKREGQRDRVLLLLFLLLFGEREEVIFDRKKKKCKQNCVCDWNFGRWENVSL